MRPRRVQQMRRNEPIFDMSDTPKSPLGSRVSTSDCDVCNEQEAQCSASDLIELIQLVVMHGGLEDGQFLREEEKYLAISA
jgi:hypothetical protein